MSSSRFDDAVCCVCTGPARRRYPLCFCCGMLVGQLEIPLAPVAVMTDFRVGDAMHRLLRGYKDAPVVEARLAYVTRLVTLFGRWLSQGKQFDGRSESAWDVVTTVPSTTRPSGSPVDAVVSRIHSLRGRHRTLLIRGPEATGHLAASRQGFALHPAIDPEWVRNRRVLVVDDTLVTGARAQSASATLRLHGARATSIVAIGRLTTCRERTVSGVDAP